MVRGRGRGRGPPTGRGQGSGRGFKSAQNSKERRPLAQLTDYLKGCTKTIESLNKEEAEMMAARAVDELGPKMLDLVADQRGSRPVEKLLPCASTETFASLCQLLIEKLPELAPNQYASHVLESLLANWAERSERPVTPIVDACSSLSTEGGWSTLVHNACASHVMRNLLLLLGGYVPETQGKGRAAARAGLLPERTFQRTPELDACRRQVAEALLALLEEDPEFCLGPHASPVIQLLLRILRACGERALLTRVCASIVGSAQAEDAQRIDALVASAAGSRALEAVVECCGSELFNKLFANYFRKRLTALVESDDQEGFGIFLVQRVFDAIRDEPQLLMALGAIDVTKCADAQSPSKNALLVKCAEACLRVRAGLKQCATAIFAGVGLRSTTEHHRSWPTLLALQQTESMADLLKPEAKAKSKAGSETTAADGTTSEEPRAVRQLPASGAQLLGAFLRFPAETVPPLNAGLSKLLSSPEAPVVLNAMAREPKTARVLEAALAPSSAVLPKLRAKLVRAFKGALGQLAPHHIGGWVCAALWRASLSDTPTREAFAQELLAIEDRLRTDNFAVWKVCGLNQAKLHNKEWQKNQEKAGKARRLFDSILEGADPERAKAAAIARKKAEEDALEQDPILAGLMPIAEPAEPEALGEAEADERPEKSGKRKRKRQESQPASAAIKPIATSGDVTLDETLKLIAAKPTAKRRRKGKKVQAAPAPDSDDED